MGFVEAFEEFGTVFYPLLEADAGTGWGNVGEVEYG